MTQQGFGAQSVLRTKIALLLPAGAGHDRGRAGGVQAGVHAGARGGAAPQEHRLRPAAGADRLSSPAALCLCRGI